VTRIDGRASKTPNVRYALSWWIAPTMAAFKPVKYIKENNELELQVLLPAPWCLSASGRCARGGKRMSHH